jgi:hypothetical protein
VENGVIRVRLLALLAIALLALLPVVPASTTDNRDSTLTVSPNTAGDLAEHTFTFETNAELAANIGEVRVTFDKDTGVPASISHSHVLILADRIVDSACSPTATVVGAGQVVPLALDPAFATDPVDSGRVVVKVRVPDMNPGTAEGCGGGLGAQGIAADAHVTLVFTTAAGIKTPPRARPAT